MSQQRPNAFAYHPLPPPSWKRWYMRSFEHDFSRGNLSKTVPQAYHWVIGSAGKFLYVGMKRAIFTSHQEGKGRYISKPILTSCKQLSTTGAIIVNMSAPTMWVKRKYQKKWLNFLYEISHFPLPNSHFCVKQGHQTFFISTTKSKVRFEIPERRFHPHLGHYWILVPW